jgi:16S rRNA (cytosine967-C5)-methyltransferase
MDIDTDVLKINRCPSTQRANVFDDAQTSFEVQDGNSQLVALDVKPGMRVVDTCAGAGGKTLHCSLDGKQRTN